MDLITPFLALLSALALVLVLAALVRTIRRDGLGHGAPPRSHHAWDAGEPWTRHP